ATLNTAGTAILTTSALSAGVRAITATYNADGNFAGSTSGSLDQMVTTPVTTTANERFIMQVYLDLLNRRVDPVGLSAWAGALDRGVSRAAVVRAIADSQEYKTLAVQSFYRLYLRRTGEVEGVRAWVSFLNAGGSLVMLRKFFVSAPEYFQTRADGNTTRFLSAVYQDAFNRSVDPIGQTAWERVLRDDPAGGRFRVADGVFTSREFSQTLVQSFYQQFLRRSAELGGLTVFANALQSNVQEQEVIAAIVASNE